MGSDVKQEKDEMNRNRIAIYRCLYGADFIQESISSIIDHVDRVYIFYDTVPWGNVTEVTYKGARIFFPKRFDDILDKICDMHENKIYLIYDHIENNINQFTHLVNDIIIPKYGKPDDIMIIEVDHIFKKSQLVESVRQFRESKFRCADTGQIELWKTFEYRIPERQMRTGVVFWRMDDLDEMPPTLRQGERLPVFRLSTHVHNFGFCMSKQTMFWKHLLALAFSQKIGDGQPDENWFEEKWLNWHSEKNNFDLEISKGRERDISHAYYYDARELPEVIREKLFV
jgi:hypothetical protein